MHILPSYFYDLNLCSIALRLILALIMGGAIGLERGATRHPAGFRTHILVCMGAAIAMLTNQFITDAWGTGADPARLGAQVITGVGFLGAGTILLTGRNKIKGLTTAAGLWASACLGLAIGIGFYEGALIATVLILISLALLPKIEDAIYEHSGYMAMYVEVTGIEALKRFMTTLKEEKIRVEDTDFSHDSVLTPGGIGVNVILRLPRKTSPEEVVERVANIDGVSLVDEQ